MLDPIVRYASEPSSGRRRFIGLATATAMLLALSATPAQAGSVQVSFPQEPEVTVVQGSSTNFTLLVEAQGAIPCGTTSTDRVIVDSLYSLDTVGGLTSAASIPMPVKTTEQRGESDNCSIASPLGIPLTATAAPETPVGDYTGFIRYGYGGDGDIDLDGPKLTIRVVAPATTPPLEEKAVASPEILVLGERRAAPGPVLGKSVMLTRVRGAVTYRMPGKAVATLGSTSVVVPNGTLVDATNGVVKVVVVRSRSGGLDSADAWGGAFVASQSSASPPITTLTLSGAIASSRKAAGTARRARARKRALWVSGKGNFKTRGKRASAIVRGTTWLTEDTSAGTRVSVKTGVVAVRDFVKRTTTLVGRGESYLARVKSGVSRRAPAFTGSR